MERTTTPSPIKLWLFIAFTFLLSSAYAQIPKLDWAKNAGGPGEYCLGNSINTDINGNVYVAGTFSGTIDFDPGPGIFEVSSVTEQDAYLLKLDINGGFIWVRNMGLSASSIVLDGAGNIYVTGIYYDDGNFGTFPLTNNGHTDIFVCKLDSDGNFLWAQGIGGPEYEYSNSITLEPSADGHDVYVTGSYQSTVDFDPGVGVTPLSSVAGSDDVFVLKLDEDGSFLWARSMGGTESETGNSISVHMGKVFLTGYFNDTSPNDADFDPNGGTAYLVSNGEQDIFICSLTKDGDFDWAKQIGGLGHDYGNSITADASGNVYTTGSFYYPDPVDFDPGPGIFELTATGNPEDIFILKLDPAGDFVWAKSMESLGGDSNGVGYSITASTTGDIYVAGHFYGAVDFDPDPAVTFFLTSDPGPIFISKYSSAGDLVWASAYGGHSNDVANSIVLDIVGNTYVTGSFQGTDVDFDPGNCVFNLSAVGQPDIFIQKIGTTMCSGLAIVLQPESMTVVAGETVILEVEATGTTNISYQWQIYNTATDDYEDLNSNGIYSGVSTSTLSVNTTGSVGEGNYRCKVSGDLSGDVFSDDASLTFSGNGLSLSNNHIKQFPITNGYITNIVAGDSYSVIRGGFDGVGPYQGSGAVINSVTGAHDTAYPIFHFGSGDIISDGSGGWYITSFSDINGEPTGIPVHIKADKTIDENMFPKANGTVSLLALDGNTLYIAGSFTQIDGTPRNRLAAFDITTRTLLPWDTGINSINFLDKLTVSGGIVYVGGQFTSIGGAPRKNIAAIDGTTGVVTAWNPTADGINASVSDILVSGSLVYLSGYFSTIGGTSRRSLAAIDITTGVATSWNPNPTGIGFGSGSVVEAMLISGSTMYMGGTFTKVGGTDREYLAAVDISTGLLTSWDPNFDDSRVYTLALSGTTLYAGGTFSTVNGLPNKYLVAVSTVDGTLQSWNPDPNAYVLNMALSGTSLFVTGDYFQINWPDANNFAVVDNTTGDIYLADLDLGGGTIDYAMTSGNTLYVSGSFTQVNGQSRQGLAAVDITTGTVLPWSPTTDNLVSAISVNGTSVYLGGNFSDVNGDSRNGLAAVDATTGNTLSWNAGVTINGEVKTLYATTDQLYIGGDFTDVNGLARNRVASFNLSTGSLLPWNPATGDLQDVVKIEVNAKWVAVKNSSDEVTAFSSTSGIVNDNFTNISDFTLADDQLILGPSLSAYDLYNNDYTSWSPDVGSDPDGDPAVSAVAFAADKIIVGGYFDNMGFEGRTNLGAYLATIPSSLIQITTQPTDLTSCLGESITFTVAATGTTNLTYQWQFSTDGIVFTDLIDNDNYANTTTATLSVNTTNNIGAGHYRCQINGDLSLASFTNDITLAINALPSAPIASNQSSCLEASVTLSASGGTDGAYRWYTEATAGSNISGEVNSNYTTTILDETSIYYVSLINSLCESNRTPITITIGGSACVGSGELVVYNGISPNGDLYNEKWIIENIELSTETRENKVSIYNRWGSQVFEVADYNNDTNVFKGLNQNGGELPSGTYYYKIEFTNGQSSKTGYLVLKR